MSAPFAGSIQIIGPNGIVPFALIDTFVAGTTTFQAAYTTAGLSVAHTNPIVCDVNGRAALWPHPALTYRIRARLADGTPIAGCDWDNVTADLTAITTSLANTADPLKGDAMIGVKRIATGAVATSLHNWIEAQPVNAAAEFGGVIGSAANQTTVVQLALNGLGANGGLVEVPRGVRFNLQSLVFPIRSNITYWMDDDLSRPNPATTLATNERVFFQANANGSGIVNEERVTAAFHPSLNIDLRRDVAGHDAHLGAGQVRVPTSSAPARASLNIFDQQVDAFRVLYEIYGGAYSNFTGLTQHSWRRTVTVTGVGTGAGGWVSAPAVGDEITGSVSGAKGWFLSTDATTTTILWSSGKFAVTDRLIDSNETTVNAVSAVAFSNQLMQPFGQDLMRGNWSVGLPIGGARDTLAVAGGVCAMPTRTFGQHIPIAHADPFMAWADAVADVPTNGYRIRYDTTPATASRRLWLTTYGSAAKLAPIGILRAKTAFSNTALVDTSAVNIATIVRVVAGRYTVTFTTAFVRADYAVALGSNNVADFPKYNNVATGSVDIFNYNSAGAQVDLVGQVSVVVVGGDI